MSGRLVAAWLAEAARVIALERSHLTDLDAAIGDGDHGINMDRGFSTILERLGSLGEPEDGGQLLVEAGRTILGTVGGASGALYGRGLMRAGARISELHEAGGPVDAGEVVFEGLVAASGAIAALGRSAVGDKTMLDALVPAGVALRAEIDAGGTVVEAIRAASAAAEDGARATIPLLARKGRASYLGERSVGHIDPGAVSSTILIRALADVAVASPESLTMP